MLSRMRTLLSQIGINANTRNLIIPISFALPILILYVLDPVSFESTWKGRAPFLLFLWLLLLELALGWKKLLNGKRSIFFFLQKEIVRAAIPKRLKLMAGSKRTNFLLKRKIIRAAIIRTEKLVITVFRMVPVYIIVGVGAVPTIYVLGTFLFGLDTHIIQLGKLVGVPYQKYGSWFLGISWPLSLEYLLFTFFLVASVLLMYQIDGLKRFSISIFFLGATSFFYMIDTFYPHGTIVVLQSFAPVTALCAIQVLNWMGYSASISRYTEGMPVLRLKGRDIAAIGWPCAGVHSLFIYTFVILLFLKGTKFSLKRKIIYMAVGAIGTFIINVLRIVTICIIGVNAGEEFMKMFHEYYGELFFVAWIIVYPLTIIYGHKIWAELSMLGRKMIETGRRPLKATQH